MDPSPLPIKNSRSKIITIPSDNEELFDTDNDDDNNDDDREFPTMNDEKQKGGDESKEESKDKDKFQQNRMQVNPFDVIHDVLPHEMSQFNIPQHGFALKIA